MDRIVNEYQLCLFSRHVRRTRVFLAEVETYRKRRTHRHKRTQ